MSAARALTIEHLVANTAELPSLSAAVIAVMRETDSPTGSAQSVARYISQDPALASKILRLANSAYYSLTRQIMEVQEAVVVLGMRTVRNLAIIAGTYPWLSKELQGYRQGPGELWAHSFATAVAAQIVARRVGYPPEQAFAAGLLHNLGKVALSLWLEHRGQEFNDAHESDASFDELERLVLGFDHSEVGAHLAEHWNLPKQLVRSIRWHHAPNDCDRDETLVDIVHLADTIAMAQGLSGGIDGLRYRFAPESIERLGLTMFEIDELVSQFLDEYGRSDKLFQDRAA